jgi:TonB family protein
MQKLNLVPLTAARPGGSGLYRFHLQLFADFYARILVRSHARSIPVIWALGLGQIMSSVAQTPTSPPLIARPTPAVVVSPVEEAKLILSHPTPEYPAEARARQLSGTGLYELHVLVETGEVSSVTVISSTGYPILDDAAIQALKSWWLRPHTAIRVKVPITFKYKKDST